MPRDGKSSKNHIRRISFSIIQVLINLFVYTVVFETKRIEINGGTSFDQRHCGTHTFWCALSIVPINVYGVIDLKKNPKKNSNSFRNKDYFRITKLERRNSVDFK